MVIFLESQGYRINKNNHFQDNQSTKRMSNNGIDSCTGNSRHINICHFFLKFIIHKGEIEFKYFLTHLMISDYLPNHCKEKCSNFFLILSWDIFTPMIYCGKLDFQP